MTDSNPYLASPEFEKGRILLANLGSFWADIFGGSTRLAAKLQGDLRANAQAGINFLELVSSISRFQVPVYHRQNWQYLTLLESDLEDGYVAPLLYGGVATFGEQYNYGDAEPTTRFRFALPAGLTGASQILNRPIKPSVILTEGIHYRLDLTNRYIEFVDNPFDNELFGTRSTVDDDTELDIFLCGASYDWKYIERQFGYALGLYLGESNEHYRNLVNAYWDALSGGPSNLSIRRGIAAACHLPLVQEASETVEYIVEHPSVLQVVTDQHVYDFPAGSTPVVAAGDEVYQGDLLTDAVILMDSTNDIETALSTLTGLSIGRNFCNLKLKGSLTFRNADYAVEHAIDDDGHAIAVFEGIDGLPDDIELFWEHAITVGKETGNSIAQSLRRVEGTSQPRADELVSTVNPMEYILQQLFRGGLTVAAIKTDYLGANVKLVHLNYLRQILPAHMALLFATTTEADEESYTGDVDITDTLDWFSAYAIASEDVVLTTGYKDLKPRINLIRA